MHSNKEIYTDCHPKIKAFFLYTLLFLFGLGIFSHTVFEIKSKLLIHYVTPIFSIVLAWYNRHDLRRIFWPLTYEQPLIFLIFYSLLSLLWVQTPVVNYYSLKGMVFGLLCLLTAKLCAETYSKRTITIWIFTFWSLNVLFIIFQLYFTGKEIGSFFHNYLKPFAVLINDQFFSSNSNQVTGFALNQNRATYNLMAMFIFILFQLKNIKYILTWMILNAFALFTLGSRSGFLTFTFLSLSFLALTMRSRRVNLKVTVATFSFFIITIGIFYSGAIDKLIRSPSNDGRIANLTLSVIEDLISGKEPDNNSAAVKMDDFKTALKANQEHPFLGIGYDAFPHYAKTYGKYDIKRPYIRMHNLPHALLTEYGLLGVGILSILFFWILPKKLLSYPLFQIAAFLLASLASAWPFQVFTFWFILGIKREKQNE